MTPTIRLVPPDVAYRASWLAAFAEITDPGERDAWLYNGKGADELLPERDFAAYVAGIRRRETDPPPGFVHDTCRWAVTPGGEVVGRITCRHELANDWMRRLGGHVGYIVRPSARGRGVATEMLRQVLREERPRTIGRLLLTCDVANEASERTIVRNGGVLEGIVEGKKRFWIETA